MNNKAMHKLSYGLYIVTTKDGEKANGCIVNTAIQAASTPNQLCICINKANYTHDMVLKTGVFNVSVLSKTLQMGESPRYNHSSAGINFSPFRLAYSSAFPWQNILFLSSLH